MSKKQHHDALLVGYEGPFFPPSVDELRTELDRTENCSGNYLLSIGRKIPAFTGNTGRPITSDGYYWYWSLTFHPGAGTIAVLIPWSFDRNQNDGTQADRSIAVYARHSSEAAADKVVQQIIKTIKLERQLELRRAAARSRCN